jgi:hypothetical protein
MVVNSYGGKEVEEVGEGMRGEGLAHVTTNKNRQMNVHNLLAE